MRRERGFALLLIFVLAAAVAISLYRELPRVAFEAQRNKEEMLIQRGEQYTRAIQLFVRKIKRYPATIEELEGTNQVRFLRRRYTDPMTGKDEWRVVHVGPGGVFLDSVVHKPGNKKEEEKSVNTFTYEAPTVGSTPQAAQNTPGFPQARASERAGLPPMPGQTQPQTPDGTPANPQNPNPNIQPGGLPIMLPPGVSAPPGAFAQTGANGQPTTPFPPGAQPQTGIPIAGLPPGVFPGQPVNSQTGGALPYATQPGAQGVPGAFAQPGTTPNPAQPGQNQALNLINQLLTTPRGAVQAGTGQSTTTGTTQIGGGIGGIASTIERTGIKVYNGMSKYNEWEFLYDLTQDKSLGGVQAGGGQVGQNQTGGRPGGQQQQPQGTQQQTVAPPARTP